MKKVILTLAILFSLAIVSAEDTCNPSVTLLNQDPYPTIPGEYVKLVFQVTGLDNTNCGDISFELLGKYPIQFDPGETGFRSFKKINYVKDYETSLLIPYEVRVDDTALDGTNLIEGVFKEKNSAQVTKEFNLEVEDIIVDFEAYVKDYDYTTKELTIEVLNIGSTDIEALTMVIPKQENVEIKGSNRVVMGDLDSNEYTTADFEATPQDGEIKIDLVYSDAIKKRRTFSTSVYFDSDYFTNRVSDQKTGPSTGIIILWAVIIFIILWWIIKRIIKKRKKNKR